MSNNASFFSHRVRLAGMVDVLMMLGLAGSWLGLLGQWHWGLDLFSHFRWQYGVVCLLALVWAGWGKRRGVLIVALATLGLNVWLIAGSHGEEGRTAGPAAAGVAPAGGLRLVSLNVLTSNGNHAAVLEFLREKEADVIFLMEIDRVWVRALEPLLTTHPHHLFRPSGDNFGLALFSRLPVEELRVLSGNELAALTDSPSEYVTDSVEVRLKLAGRDLSVIGIHPVPPMGAAYSRARDSQLRALAQHVDALTHPVVVVGDFNATPWSHGYRILTSGGKLQAAPDAWKPTWRAGSIFALPIDHVLSTPPLVIRLRGIGRDVGSDHRGQVIDLGWAE